MNNFFGINSPLMRFLSKAADLLILNLLWMLCSIPVVTIGASTSALYYMCFKINGNEEISLFKGYFKAFKDNLKQATIIWLLLCAIVIGICFNIYILLYIPMFGEAFELVLLGVCIVMAVIAGSIFIYGFAFQSYFENTLINLLKNAVVIGIGQLGRTILMLVFDVAVIIFGALYCPFVAIALPVWFNVKILRRILQKYTLDFANSTQLEQK